MAEDDWYRGAEWDAEAQALFRQKLARARDQKWFYMRIKAGAIATDHPDDALALYQECLDRQEDDEPPILYAMAIVHWRQGREDKLFEYLDLAMGEDGMDLGAPGVMENAFVSGLLGRTERYERALGLFEPLDKAAQSQAGRNFVRSFAGAFGSAIMLDYRGRAEEAREAALTALEWSEKGAGPIPGHPQLGLPPRIPAEWTARMAAIAEKGA